MDDTYMKSTIATNNCRGRCPSDWSHPCQPGDEGPGMLQIAPFQVKSGEELVGRQGRMWERCLNSRRTENGTWLKIPYDNIFHLLAANLHGSCPILNNFKLIIFGLECGLGKNCVASKH